MQSWYMQGVDNMWDPKKGMTAYGVCLGLGQVRALNNLILRGSSIDGSINQPANTLWTLSLVLGYTEQGRPRSQE